MIGAGDSEIPLVLSLNSLATNMKMDVCSASSSLLNTSAGFGAGHLIPFSIRLFSSSSFMIVATYDWNSRSCW